MPILSPRTRLRARRAFRSARPLVVSIFAIGAGVAGLWPIGFAATEVAPAPAPVAELPPPKVFPSVELAAASAIVVDLRTGQTFFERDADTPRPLASITKLMTALVASRALSPDATVRIASTSWSEEGPSFVLPPEPQLDAEGNQLLDAEGNPLFFEAREVTAPATVHTVPVVAKVRDALAYALVASSNEAAAALGVAAGPGEAAFVARMNAEAESLGLRTMRFENPSGLDIGSRASAVGSARDVASLLSYLVASYPSLVAPTSETTVTVPTDQGPLTARNTNKIAGALPNLVAGKTGLETSAGGNLAVVIDPGLGQPIAIVALGSTAEGRFADVRALADATVAYLSTDATTTAATR